MLVELLVLHMLLAREFLPQIGIDSKVEDGDHGPEKASQRLPSLQAMSPAPERQYTASPPDFMRYKLLEIERA